MERAKEKWMAFIDISFLSDDFKDKYKQLIQERFARLLPNK
jgi:serine/threonine-protein kinase HipA